MAHQVPLSVEFSRREHWSELTFPSPHDMEAGLKWQKSLLQREKNIRNDFVKSWVPRKAWSLFPIIFILKKKKKKSRSFEFSIFPFLCISPFSLLLFQLLLSFAFLWINPFPCFHISEFAYTLDPCFLYRASIFYWVLGFHAPRG